MARFIGRLKGARGPVSRIGHGTSGLIATVDGWDCGVRIVARAEGKTDIIEVFATGGSNGTRPDKRIAQIEFGPER